MRLLEGCSILYTGSAFRVSVIGAKLVVMTWRKQLSHYLYFLFFSFFFILDLLHRRKCGKVSCYKCHTVVVT